ncbi:hypothetical protein [Rhodoflexus sp.]
MAQLEYFVDLNLNKQQVKNQRIHNVTDTEETALAATLTAADKGLVVYNTTSNSFKAWNGTAFTGTSPAGLLLFTTTVDLVANTPLTVTPTGIARPYQVQLRLSNGRDAYLQVTENNDNTIALESHVAITGLSVRVIGAAA